MTISEMHNEFLVLLDKSNSLEYPDFNPEEIDIFLNKAQEAIVKQRFSGNNIKRDSLEETQKRLDDLRNLVKNSNTLVAPITSVDNKPNGRFVDLPTDYWFTIEDECTITKDCHGNLTYSRIPVKSVTHDRYNKIINDPFNRPGSDFVIKLFVGDNNIELITGDSNATTSNNLTYHLRYISKPVEMSFDNNISCSMSEHIHREIVDYAVNLALEDIGSERFKTQIVELQRNE